MTHCGNCHTCGTKLSNVLDGEQWCPKCQQYRRYRSHGWTGLKAKNERELFCPNLSCPPIEHTLA